MSFVFPLLLGGLALTAIPVLLHLIMRQKPKTLRFPAFRFLINRHRRNQRKLQLRHLLLLVMRMLLIAAICLALARPKLLSSRFGLEKDRPVNAVFLFDTSYSMEYKTSDGKTRLDEAKARALELLEELPDGSRFAILDTAETSSGGGEWLDSKLQARRRIDNLKLRFRNSTVTQTLPVAYRLFTERIRGSEDPTGSMLPRLLCVFSDRTIGSWSEGQMSYLQESSDQIPPLWQGLDKVKDEIPGLIELLEQLRTEIPPPEGQDYPELGLIESLGQLREHISTVQREEINEDEKLAKLLPGIRQRCRQILFMVRPKEGDKDISAYRQKLVDALNNTLRQLQGVYTLFIDVGIEKPVDLAISDFKLPRNNSGQTRVIFDQDEKIDLQVEVRGVGNNFDTEVLGQVLRTPNDKGSFRQVVILNAKEEPHADSLPLSIDCERIGLAPGTHQVEVRLRTNDLLPFTNTRYLSFGIRKPQRILVITEEPADSNFLTRALRNAPERYRPVILKPDEVANADLGAFRTIYLFQVKKPSTKLWNSLTTYVQKGGGLAIVPGGRELDTDAYNQAAAQQIMPGKLKGIVADKKGAKWNLADTTIFQHPIMRPFRSWRDNTNIDFIRFPRSAFYFWDVLPDKKEGSAVVSYANEKDHPALLERQFDPKKGTQGHVLLFTTPLDLREPAWNDYFKSKTSFYLVMITYVSRYLMGELQRPTLNFQADIEEPVIPLPPRSNYPDYILRGPNFTRVQPKEGENLLRLGKYAEEPGNYTVEGVSQGGSRGKIIGRFSVNLSAQEGNLDRHPSEKIELLLGAGSVVPVARKASIGQALDDHFPEPLELFPFLMILLLFVLAFESLLANKFYKAEPAQTP